MNSLRIAREEKGLAVAECASKVGVLPEAWRRWESGKSVPRADVFDKIFKMLAEQ